MRNEYGTNTFIENTRLTKVKAMHALLQEVALSWSLIFIQRIAHE
ncbi:hypothetical protein PAMC26577_20620 [Caballeronia sordidicola]|uniref:Uncharacterized protein n=1 Tax=Caballeronia sordidicola TaxID=196367 RepID=A0A242MNF6_CABSO|nr:hypothetical protein PAMC26577_20620 [Caballeronia sordidicola]